MEDKKNSNQAVDMYSQLADQLDNNRRERYEKATVAINQTMTELNLTEENERVKEAQAEAEANVVVIDPNMPRALRNPKSKTVTLLQCFGIMLIMLGIQLVVGLPIGSYIANSVKTEAIAAANTLDEFMDAYMDLYMQRYSESVGSITLIITVVSLLVGLIWYVRGYVGKDALSKFKAAAQKTFTPRMLGIIVLLGIGLQFGMAVVASMEDLIVPKKIIEDYEETFSMAGLTSLPGILAVVVAAPINEELFFRGIIYRKMKTAWSGVGPVVAAALLFSLMHLIPYQVIYTIPAGFALALVAKRYDSILPGILVHMCVNGFSFGLQLVSDALGGIMNEAAITLVFLVISGVCIGLAVKLMKGENRSTAA